MHEFVLTSGDMIAQARGRPQSEQTTSLAPAVNLLMRAPGGDCITQHAGKPRHGGSGPAAYHYFDGLDALARSRRSPCLH